MLRTAVAVGVGLLLVAGTTLAQTRPAQTPPAAQPGQVAKPNFMTGKIVKIDPATNKIWIQTGTGATAQERAFMLDKNARFFGANSKALEDGLKAEGFRPGATVNFRLGTGANPGISQLGLGPLPPLPAQPLPPAGGGR